MDGSLDAATAPATPGDGCGGGSTTGQIDRAVIGNDDGQACQESLASVHVPPALALAENSKQEWCKGWCRLILRNSAHPHALV